MRSGSAERVTSSPWAGKIERAFAATWVAFSLVTFFWRDKRKLLANGENSYLDYKVVSLQQLKSDPLVGIPIVAPAETKRLLNP